MGMHTMTRMVLAIADNARIDHEAGHPQPAAPFNAAKERAGVKRAAARGLLAITQSSRGEVWARITDAGRAELARMHGEPSPV